MVFVGSVSVVFPTVQKTGQQEVIRKAVVISHAKVFADREDRIVGVVTPLANALHVLSGLTKRS
ncbi:hypothetical protein DGG96_16770 [Legionella qingyii]|uniref:Uncharacterized protein n=1 Tax=Legionella qingyii TaxID=2184757 RepID=A0A317TZH4_9GAMM|nr:hypothetical protein DGG96_16770 [Legionella qingyii]